MYSERSLFCCVLQKHSQNNREMRNTISVQPALQYFWWNNTHSTQKIQKNLNNVAVQEKKYYCESMWWSWYSISESTVCIVTATCMCSVNRCRKIPHRIFLILPTGPQENFFKFPTFFSHIIQIFISASMYFIH